MSRTAERLSPNQVEKQRQIVAAARTVLARDGLAGCTARAVADASPLTKSAIHYYFPDMDDLVDRAMAEHIEAFTGRLRTAGERAGLWAAVEEYLRMFREMPASLTLWQEYWVDSIRRGRRDRIAPMFGEVDAIFVPLLEVLDAPEPHRRAHALTALLIGTATQQAVHPDAALDVTGEVAALVGTAPPRS